MQDETTLQLEHIKKIYHMGEHQVFALNGVNFKVLQGEMVAIMGASGSGKSTLLNIIGCLDKPTEGTYILDGENISNLNKNELAGIRNKKFGFVFQTFNFLGRVTERTREIGLRGGGRDRKQYFSPVPGGGPGALSGRGRRGYSCRCGGVKNNFRAGQVDDFGYHVFSPACHRLFCRYRNFLRLLSRQKSGRV